jgi:hypothetical protein
MGKEKSGMASNAASSAVSVATVQYGAPVGEYGGSKASIFLIICGVALLALGLFFAVAIPMLSNDTSGLGIDLFVGAVFIAGAVYSFWAVFSWRGAHAQLFERGFVISRAGKTLAARWDDVASVTQNIVRIRYNFIPVWTSYKYTVALNNGDSALINNGFSKVGRLGENVQRLSANTLLPRAIAAYNSGATLPFGKLSMSQAGISNGQETLPWSDLERVTFVNGGALVMRKGKRIRWASEHIRKIPNLYVMTGLVNYVQRGIR